MRRSIRTATAGLAAAGLLATAACGSDNGDDADAAGQQDSDNAPGDIIEALQASATQAEEAETVGMETTVTLTDEGGSYTILEMAGTVGWEPVALDVVMDMSGTMEMVADQMGEELPDDVPMEFQMRMIDDMMYLGLDFAQLDVDTEHTWAGISLEEAAGDDPEVAELLEQMERSDASQSPAEQIGLFLESDELEEVGEEELDGVETTRYRGTFTTDQFLELEAEQNEHLTDEMLESTRQDLDEFGADEMTIEVWIDGDGLPVRHDMVMELGTEGEMAELAPEGEMAYSTLYQDWGTTDGLEAPPEDEVMDMEEFQALVDG